jgi:hypothetical protein
VKKIVALLIALTISVIFGTVHAQVDTSQKDSAIFDTFLSKIDISGYLKNETATHLQDPGNFQKVKNYLKLEVDYSIFSNLSFHALSWNFYDAIYDLQNNQSKAAEDAYKTEISIREIYLDMTLESFDFRLGKQQVIWGEAIGLRITDVINPHDFWEFILDEFINSRIPLWMAKVNYYWGDWVVEGLWIPDFKPNKYAVEGSVWEFTFNKPPVSSEVTVIQKEPKEPGQNLKNSEWGLRLSGYLKGWDFSGSYFYTWDDDPTVHRTFIPSAPIPGPPTIVISPEHHRLHIFGLTFAKPVRSFVFRGEFSYYLDKFFQTRDPKDTDSFVQKNFLYYIVGADYTIFGNWFLNGQFIQRVITNYNSALAEDEFLNSFSLYLQTDFFHETLRPVILAIYSPNKDEYWISSKVEYEISDRIKLTLGSDIFGGEADGFFGQFDSKDRIYFELKYSF